MNRIAGSLVLVVALTVGGLAHAQDDGEKLKVAKQVLAMTLSPEQWHKITSAMDAQVRMQLSGQLSDEEAAELEIESFMPFQEVADFQLGLLMKYYTADELKQVAAFYRTPAGKKTLKVQPELAQDVNGFVMSKMQERLPQAVERLKRAHAAKASGAK